MPSERRSRLWAGSTAILLILCFAAILSWRAVHNYRKSNTWVENTNEIIGQINGLRDTMEMDQKVQLYSLSTGNLNDQQISSSSASALQNKLAALRALVADDPQQQATGDSLARDLAERAAIFSGAQHSGRRPQADLDEELKVQLQSVMSDIGANLATMLAAETIILSQLKDLNHHLFDVALIITFLSCLLTLGVIVIATSFIEKTVADRARAAEERRLATARYDGLKRNLEQRVTAREAEDYDNAELVASVIDAVTDGVIVCDSTMRTIRMNSTASKLLGAASEPFDVIAWANRHGLLEVQNSQPIQALDIPLFRALRGERSDNVVVRVTGPEIKGEIWHEVSARTNHDAEGKITGAVAIFRDITERKEVGGGLQANAELVASVIDAVADGIVVCDSELRIIRTNSAAMRLMGAESGKFDMIEWVKQHELVQAGSTQPMLPLETPLFRALGGERPDNVVVRVTGPDIDGELWHEVSARASRDADGKINGAVAIFRDISARKQVEDNLRNARDIAIESARIRSEFLANMSHEIRTPLNGILGMAQLMGLTNLDPQQREYAETIWTSSEMLLSIVNDILDFSKVAAGKMPIEEIDFDLVGAVEASVDSLAERAQAKNLELAISIDPAVPQLARGDSKRLRQVLTNLIGNAVKFTDRGEVVVRASRIADTGDDVMLAFEVIDTGIGIASDVASQLFRPFVQADGSTSRKYGGTGLGLAICAQLVERMGGDIGVKSVLGKGSTFHFTIRLAQPSRPFPIPSGSQMDLSGQRMLVVDDNETHRNIMTSQLASWGVEADSVAAGVQALVVARDRARAGRPYQVALLNMNLPAMNAVDLAHSFRADPLLNGIRIIVMSSVAATPNPAKRDRGSIDAWLSKPVKRAKLLAQLCAPPPAASDTAKLTDSPAPIAVTDSPKPPASPLVNNESRGKARIMVVDDDPINRAVARNQLAYLGYEAHMAPDAQTAVDLARGMSFDLVLMDCQMPEIDGYEATRMIRDLDGPNHRTTVIALTAHSGEGTRAQCAAASMDDYIGKPVRLDHLAAALDHWMSKILPSKSAPAAPPIDAVAADPILDEEVMADFREMSKESGQDELAALTGSFLAGVPKRLQRLHEVTASGDAAALKHAAHTFRSASASMGARRLARLCGEIEHNTKDGSVDGAYNLIGEVEREVPLLREMLAAESSRIVSLIAAKGTSTTNGAAHS